jgi:hypothetical protein
MRQLSAERIHHYDEAFLAVGTPFFGDALALPLVAFWPLGAPFFWVAPFFEEAFSGATCAPSSATEAAYLAEKNPDNWTRTSRKKRASLQRARVAYLAWKILPSVAIVAFSTLCVIGTHTTQLTKHLTAVEDDLVPADDPDPTTECELKYPLAATVSTYQYPR